MDVVPYLRAFADLGTVLDRGRWMNRRHSQSLPGDEHISDVRTGGISEFRLVVFAPAI